MSTWSLPNRELQTSLLYSLPLQISTFLPHPIAKNYYSHRKLISTLVAKPEPTQQCGSLSNSLFFPFFYSACGAAMLRSVQDIQFHNSINDNQFCISQHHCQVSGSWIQTLASNCLYSNAASKLSIEHHINEV